MLSAAEKIAEAFRTGEPWEDLFPLRGRDGVYRWFLSRGLPIRDGEGRVLRWFGTNTDVTEEKESEDRQLLLMREIDHRAQNALAVAQAVVKLTRGDTIGAYKAAVEGWIAALARAHSLLADTRWEGADIARIVAEETGPYIDPAAPGAVGQRRSDQAQPVAIAVAFADRSRTSDKRRQAWRPRRARRPRRHRRADRCGRRRRIQLG